MANLIEELQRNAVDDSVAVATLLRRMKIAAVKLRLGQLEDWIRLELDGYPGANPDLPPYRLKGGFPVGEHTWHGWQPMQTHEADEESYALTSVAFLTQPIDTLENLIRGCSDTDSVRLSFPRFVEEPLLRYNQGTLRRVALSVTVSAIRSTVSAVRDRVLDWALEMERAGVMGENMSFTDEERERAARLPGEGIIINVHGQNARATIGSDHSNNQVVNGNVLGDLRSLIEAKIPDAADKATLLARVAEMERTQGTPAFTGAYNRFIEAAANHMAILAPVAGGLIALFGC